MKRHKRRLIRKKRSPRALSRRDAESSSHKEKSQNQQSSGNQPGERPTQAPYPALFRAVLMVRLDAEGKAFLAQAAELRRISVSDYVRTVTVPQARAEVFAAREQTIALTPDEQLAFWQALSATPKLTPAQRRLGKAMRGES